MTIYNLFNYFLCSFPFNELSLIYFYHYLQGELPSGSRVLHISPSRFTRTSQSRTWSTGNGSPDAICFYVDRPGIVIAGVCIYGGVGVYDYEVELMDESGGGGQDGSHALERWSVIEMARGTFTPDDSVADIVEVKFERPVPIKVSFCFIFSFLLNFC